MPYKIPYFPFLLEPGTCYAKIYGRFLIFVGIILFAVMLLPFRVNKTEQTNRTSKETHGSLDTSVWVSGRTARERWYANNFSGREDMEKFKNETSLSSEAQKWSVRNSLEKISM